MAKIETLDLRRDGSWQVHQIHSMIGRVLPLVCKAGQRHIVIMGGYGLVDSGKPERPKTSVPWSDITIVDTLTMKTKVAIKHTDFEFKYPLSAAYIGKGQVIFLCYNWRDGIDCLAKYTLQTNMIDIVATY